MKGKKTEENNKGIIVKRIAICIIIAIAVYTIYIIYGLIKKPTNIFVVENGKLTMEEETIRIYYTRRERFTGRELQERNGKNKSRR